MGRFKGAALPVGELLVRSLAEPEPDWAALSGDQPLRNDAAGAAAHCAELLAAGDSLASCWRFGILQTVDYYDSAVRRGGSTTGAQVFTRVPAQTGSDAVDAAFAALAQYLAARDGWDPPAWSADRARVASERWYVAQLPAFRPEADRESPPEFRSRNVFIGANDLNRA